jgi:hypothetical protein
VSLDHWLDEVGTAALVGTSRREPPPVPADLGVAGDDDAPAEHRLLASAALADALARAGAPLSSAAAGPNAVDLAPAESLPACSDQAAQLLQLLLTQPPVSKLVRDDLVVEWLHLADAAGRRVPEWMLPPLLDFAAARRPVARALGTTLGERGTWLAGLNEAWSELLEEGPAATVPDGTGDWTEVWPTLPTAEAVPAFATGRREDPRVACDLLAAHWDTLSAKVRADALLALRHGLSADDEPLLERALDDRAVSVRGAAARVLARLPGSELSLRMADRLRALVHVKGTVVRHLEVDLPDAPDDAAIRDGLTPPAKNGRTPPTTWLAEIVLGAPLTTWTDLTRRSVPSTLKMVRDKDVLAWIVEAVVDRRDAEWAAACVAHGVPAPRLVWLLPREDRTRLLVSWVTRPPAGRDLRSLLAEAPRPWPEELGRAVLAGIQRSGGNPVLLNAATPLLPAAVGPSLGPEVRAALERVPDDATHLRRALTETLQLHAFRTSLTEAFR